jgi:hypothetical protein
MPDGTLKGVIGGVAVGVSGPSMMNAAITSAAGSIGYQIGGAPEALIGGAVGAKFSEKINNAYQTTPTRNESRESGYEEIPSYSQQRINGGSVVQTRNMRQRDPCCPLRYAPALTNSVTGDTTSCMTEQHHNQ